MSSFPPPPPPFGNNPPIPPSVPPPPPPFTQSPAPQSGVQRKVAGLPLSGWLGIAVVAIFAVVGFAVMSGDDDKAAVSGNITVAPTRPADTEAPVSPTIAPTDTDPGSTEPDQTVAPDEPVSGDEVPDAPEGLRGGRDNPVPAGEIADIGGGWRLQVVGLTPDATDLIAQESEFNEPPATGSNYTLVKVALGYYGRDDPASAFGPTITAVGSENVELPSDCGSVPDELDVFSDLFAGGVLTGNLCITTAPTDIAPLQLAAIGDFFADTQVFLEVATPSSFGPLPTLNGPRVGATSTPGRLQPTPVGIAAEVGDGWSITVTSPARDITDLVLAENSFNEPPPTGFRFIGVEVTYAYSGTGSDSGFAVTTAAVADRNVELAKDCGVIPTPLDEFIDVFAGGSITGSLCFVVPEGTNLLTIYSLGGFESDPVMFATG